MENIYENITLDLHDVHSMAAITVKQGDTARILKIHFMEEGVPYSPGDGCYAVLVGIKSDGTYLYNQCEVEKDCIRYEFTKQTASVSGEVNCEVRLYDSDDRMLTSGNFQILVEEQLSVDDLVESGAETTALNHLVSEATAVIQTGNSLFGEGQNLLETAGTVLEEVKQAKDATCLAADNAVKLVEEAEQVICQASDAAKAADSAAQRANEASVLAEDAYEVAQSADRKVETLRNVVSKLHSNIVCGAEGEVIRLSDASDMGLAGLHIFGKTTQNGIPTPEAPVPLESVGESINVTVAGKNLCHIDPIDPYTHNGVTVSVKNGGLLLSGELTDKTTQGNIHSFAYRCAILQPGTYTVSFSCLSQPQVVAKFFNLAGNKSLDISVGNTSRLKDTVTINEPSSVYWGVYRNAGYNENIPSEPIYIQIEAGSTATEYEPYKDPTTATVTPVTGTGESLYLHGIPVSSGGNYTDENDQEWICDEVDLEKGVYVQRIGKFTYDGSVSENWGKSSSTSADRFYKQHSIYERMLPVLTNMFRFVGESEYTPGVCFLTKNASGAFYIEVIAGAYGTFADVTAWRNYLNEHPLEVLYVLPEEKTIYLSEENPPQYAALHTHYPNTTIFNDSGAHMEVRYIADTQKYVDKKFEALEAAIANLI